jgi:hypothetical protein
VGFVVDKRTLGQVLSDYVGFSSQSLNQMPHNHHHHHHPSLGAGKIG